MVKLILVSILLFSFTSLATFEHYGFSQSFYLDTVNPSVIIVSPNGGETWQSGSQQSINWEILETHPDFAGTCVQISLDAGMTWHMVTGLIPCFNGVSLPVIYPVSDSVLVRVTGVDQFGNTGTDNSDDLFRIILGKPSPPQSVRISILDFANVLLEWDPVSTNENGNPIEVSGYVVLCGNDPCVEGSLSYLGTTTETSFIHIGAATQSSRMFYCILAYTGELEQLGP